MYALRDQHILAEGAAHVLGRLGLAGASGAGGRTAEAKAERLREGDVAAVGERRDDKALLDAEVLVAVVKIDVGDVHLGDVEVVAPVEARLLRPLKVLDVLDLLLHHLLEDVARVHVDEDHRLNLLARPLAKGGELLVGLQVDGDEVVEALLVLLVGLVHHPLLRLGAIERVLTVEGPDELDADE